MCSYGLDLFLLSIDEGIAGYREDCLETVKRNKDQYALPLKIISYKELYGWTMDEIVKQIGTKNNCTFCGVFRRQVSGNCLESWSDDDNSSGTLYSRFWHQIRTWIWIRFNCSDTAPLSPFSGVCIHADSGWKS